jgi:hypothetical protein
MTRQKNRKRRKKAGRSRVKTIIAAVILGGLSAFGLWQCFDNAGQSPLSSIKEIFPEKIVDVGEGVAPDPTLVNETALLESENHSDLEESDGEAPVAQSDENKISIDEAGEAIKDNVEEENIEEKFPMYAVAYHFHTQIKARTNPDSRTIGYARRGSTFRVSERVSTKGCARGWHEISGGGFICDGLGINVGSKPVTFAPSPPMPRLNNPLPYDYKYAKEDSTPEYWRIPTSEEIQETGTIFKLLEAGKKLSETGAPAIQNKKTLEEVLAGAESSTGSAQMQGADAGITVPVTAPAAAITKLTEEQTEGDGGVGDPHVLPPYVHLRMAKGYYVSTDDKVAQEDVTYQRTIRNRFIQADKLYEAKPSNLEGILINHRNQLPVAFIIGRGVKLLEQKVEGGPLKSGERLSRFSHLPYLGEMKRKGKRYAKVGDNLFVPRRTVAVALEVQPPENLLPGERWIDIDLSQQTLVAYEGASPIFATLISSGRKDFDTPEGSFRIYGKHVSITMDDPEGGEEAYSIEDVPWTQYFEEGYALHAAFWHNGFGRVRSHGCVNLSPADARRLFFWTGPNLSAGYHGIVATRDNPGTRVVIHR